MNLDKVLVWNIADEEYMECELSKCVHVSLWKFDLILLLKRFLQNEFYFFFFWHQFLKECVEFLRQFLKPLSECVVFWCQCTQKCGM